MLRKQKIVIAISAGCLGLVLLLYLFSSSLGFFQSHVSEWGPGSIRFSIASTDDDRPIFIFRQSTIDYSRHPFIGFNIFELKPSNPSLLRPVWTIVERIPSNKQVQSLTYGECPERFREVKAAEPLVIGRFYRVDSSDIFKKVAPLKYEIIPLGTYERYVKNRLIQDPL